jgi:hypothetical protein
MASFSPVGGECLGNALADASGGTCDQGYFSFE